MRSLKKVKDEQGAIIIEAIIALNNPPKMVHRSTKLRFSQFQENRSLVTD